MRPRDEGGSQGFGVGGGEHRATEHRHPVIYRSSVQSLLTTSATGITIISPAGLTHLFLTELLIPSTSAIAWRSVRTLGQSCKQ
jgi:hypothetical protein